MPEDRLAPFAEYGIRDLALAHDPERAVARLQELYRRAVERLRDAFASFLRSGRVPETVDSFYPYLGVRILPSELNLDGRFAYGVAHEPGIYGTTITRPDLFADYFRTQLGILMANHRVPVVVGVSRRRIPLPYAGEEPVGELPPELIPQVQHLFPMPDLSHTDDSIANGTWRGRPGEPRPLALFTAERVDYSLHRLVHYTGTSPEHFQRFILLTNYQRYVDHFLEVAQREITEGEEYDRLVEPGDAITPNPRLRSGSPSGDRLASLPQMPAWHLCRPDGRGISLVNIGVGPSNARTITDHLAVLRPHCWLMLGHCAGLRRSQKLGDYVLSHGYVREDHVLDQEVPAFVPVPPIAEVQIALQEAVARVTGLSGLDLKTRMRTGTVATTANRNWELRYDELYARLSQSRAIAVDMESATIAANGLRFRVPYGTLLCVSDKPLHGELKLRGMANQFYRERVAQHLLIGLEAVRILREQGPERLHSRKLRTFDEPPFR
ncbi:AMP nucleosidase [bacterium HR40]|nr:AMP nucleosidase [bacterium HR40]